LLAVGAPLVWFVSQWRLHGGGFLALHFSFTVDNLPLTQDKSAARIFVGLFEHPRLLAHVYWPWLPLMIVGMAIQLRKMIRERDPASSLLVLWVFCVIVPFSLIETKWLRYIMPVFPAFAILAAIPINDWIAARRRGAGLKLAYAVLCLVIIGLAVAPKYRERPEEMRNLAPVAEAHTPPEGRILLYTEREPRWAHLYQIIWYTNRNCDLLTDPAEVRRRTAADPTAVIITDKAAIARVFGDSVPDVKILGETAGFVCWAKGQQAEAVRAGDLSAARNPNAGKTDSHN